LAIGMLDEADLCLVKTEVVDGDGNLVRRVRLDMANISMGQVAAAGFVVITPLTGA
jgi:hypothetical protein